MMSDTQTYKRLDLSSEPKSEEYTLRETVNLLGSEWLRTLDVTKLKEYRKGDLSATSNIIKKLNEFHKFSSRKAVPTEDESVLQVSQTNRKYFPCKMEHGRMTSSGALSLWGPLKAVLFDGVGTDADQCKAAQTSLTWLLKEYPMQGDTCYGLQDFMEDPDAFIESVMVEKGWTRKQAKSFINTVFFNFMNRKMNFGPSDTMKRVKKLRDDACVMQSHFSRVSDLKWLWDMC